MSDLSEMPAVPPMETGGDERAGFRAAGSLLVVLGWGFGLVVNVLVHVGAPSTGRAIGPIVVFAHLGPFAWAILLFGAFVGALGVAILAVARASPRGPLVLPGFAY